MLAGGTAAQAQVLSESFDAAQTKVPTDPGYYEFINMQELDAQPAVVEGGFSGSCLKFDNIGDGPGWWSRAVKFRNLKFEEGKSYRLNFKFKGDNSYLSEAGADVKSKMSVSLMQGGENADIALLDPKGNEFRYEISYFNPENYENYTRMFYFASAQAQKDKFEELNGSKEDYQPLADTFFATFNVYSPGVYFLDEVTIEEASIAGVSFGSYAVRVDFGYPTNIAAMANAALPHKRVIMPNDCAKVTVNGTVAEVETVELWGDGFMYVFLKEQTSEGDKIEVSFTNPTDEKYQILYTGNLSPEGPVASFETEVASFQTALTDDEEYTPWIYTEPYLVSTSVADGSFNLAEDFNSVTFMFDKPLTLDEPITALVNGKAELDLVGVENEAGEVIGVTVALKDGKTFTKGSYEISLEGVTSVQMTPAMQKFVVTFETGTIQLAEETITPVSVIDFSGDANGTFPLNWEVVYKDVVQTPGSSPGSGPRLMELPNATIFNVNETSKLGMYLRTETESTATMTLKDVTLPEGDLRLKFKAAIWSGSGINVTCDILNEDGSAVLATVSGVPAANFNNSANTSVSFENIVLAYNNATPDAKYCLRVSVTNTGFSGIQFGGVEVCTYSVSEGDVVETETIASGNFAAVGNDMMPAHGTGWKIYRNDGRMRGPGANGAYGGNCWTGGGGPRVKTLGNKNMNGGGIYLNGGSYATYGEFLVQTDQNGPVLNEEGAEVPEQAFEVKAGRYQISYGVIGWKQSGDGPWNITLDIYKQEDGIGGTPIYTRVDGSTSHCGSGGDASADATKVQFFWNAPADGKYIMKFTASGTGEGEAVVGNVLVETTASLAVQYGSMLLKALEPVKAELELSNAKEEYRGTAREALETALVKYDMPDFHTVAEYEAAFKDIDAIVKTSEIRRKNIDAYPTSLQGLVDGLAAATGTKYENLEQFPIVQAAYEQYKDVDYVALSDEDLATAVATMGDNGTLLSNMVNTCVPLLTKQIADLAAAIVALDETMSTSNTILAAGNAFTDDQALVSLLKKTYASILYKKAAAGDDLFNIVDPETLEKYPTTVDASFLIQNSQFYCTTPVVKDNVNVDVTAFPGWTIVQNAGQITSVFTTSWDGPYPTTVKPVENCAVKTGWGTQDYEVSQIIGELPVFQYEASIMIGEDGGDPHGSYAFCGETQLPYEGTVAEDGSVSYTRDNNKAENTKTFADVAPVVEDGAILGSITLGAHMFVAGGFGNVDNAVLKITALTKDFDYAAAAATLAKEVETGLNNVQKPEGEPVSVQYFNAQGQSVSQPQGLAIKVATYANGYMEVVKFFAK